MGGIGTLGRNKNKSLQQPVIDLIDEGFHLWRTAPPRLLLSYYIGSVPFVLGLLFFWADMSRSAFAEQRLAAASLLLALLYLWMKVWQSVACIGLRHHLDETPPHPWTARRVGRMIVTQCILQPLGLVLAPFAVLLLFAIPWLYAFVQNVSTCGLDEKDGVAGVARHAWMQTCHQPRQNYLSFVCLLFFSFFVFLNLCIIGIFVPQLFKIFTGIDTPMSSSHYAFMNSTYLATIVALTYLCVDPLMKCLCCLRGYIADSIKTGESMQSELRRLSKTAALLLVCWLAAAGTGAQAPVLSAPARAQADMPAVAPGQLDQSIRDTVAKPRYAWRMPRETPAKVKEEDKNFLDHFLESTGRMIKRWYDVLDKWVKRFADWLDRRSDTPERERRIAAGAQSLAMAGRVLKAFMYVVAGIILVALAILLLRAWQQRRRSIQIAPIPTAVPVPDLNDEQVSADQLPPDEWLQLAQQLMDQGDLRLALRAMYLPAWPRWPSMS